MAVKTVPQPYPRIQDETSKELGLLDVIQLTGHKKKFTPDEMKEMIRRSIVRANQKSGRSSIMLPQNATEMETIAIYQKEGHELFKYFKKSYDDPASAAYKLNRKNYREVAQEQLRNRALQRGRMNSGWRYQFLLLDCAVNSERFTSVSDLGSIEADFNAVIVQINAGADPVNLYVSIKNRRNTMGGQDWPKAIAALETTAKNDKNRTGPYCCVFGIAMDKGLRHIKVRQSDKQPHSMNTEVWLSGFLWPFFANYSYEEVMSLVLEVLMESETMEEFTPKIEVPEAVIESFGAACRRNNLIDEAGYFNDPHKLVSFFCK